MKSNLVAKKISNVVNSIQDHSGPESTREKQQCEIQLKLKNIFFSFLKFTSPRKDQIREPLHQKVIPLAEAFLVWTFQSFQFQPTSSVVHGNWNKKNICHAWANREIRIKNQLLFLFHQPENFHAGLSVRVISWLETDLFHSWKQTKMDEKIQFTSS